MEEPKDTQVIAALATILQASESNLDDDDSDCTINDDVNLFNINIVHVDDADDAINVLTTTSDSNDDDDLVIDCTESYRKAFNFKHLPDIYGVPDGGADSSIVGIHAFVISHTQ